MHHINEHVFDGKFGARRVVWERPVLPLLARHVEVGAQRPPYIAGFGTGFDGLRGGAAPHTGQHMVNQQRGTAHGSELPLDEFVEFGQPHVTKLPRHLMAHPYRISHLCYPAGGPASRLPVTRLR